MNNYYKKSMQSEEKVLVEKTLEPVKQAKPVTPATETPAEVKRRLFPV